MRKIKNIDLEKVRNITTNLYKIQQLANSMGQLINQGDYSILIASQASQDYKRNKSRFYTLGCFMSKLSQFFHTQHRSANKNRLHSGPILLFLQTKQLDHFLNLHQSQIISNSCVYKIYRQQYQAHHMIPFSKLLTLLIKTFSKPVLAFAKRNNSMNQMVWMNLIFKWIGRKFYVMEHFINSNFRNSQRSSQLKPLTDEAALEKGVEAFHEIVLYLAVLGVPLWEMNKSSNDSKIKQQKLQARIDKLEKLSLEAQQQLNSLNKSKYLIF